MFTGLESPAHQIIALGIVLLLFGAKRIPELAKGLGAGVREFKKGAEGERKLDEAPDDHKERKFRRLLPTTAGLFTEPRSTRL